MNPLLDFSGLPRFAEFKPEHVTPALDQLLAENRELIARQEADTRNHPGRIRRPLDDANERLRRAWGQAAHMNAVMNSPALREAYNANLGRISQYFTELSQSEHCSGNTRRCGTRLVFPPLTQAQRKVIDNELRDFRLGAWNFPPNARRGSSG